MKRHIKKSTLFVFLLILNSCGVEENIEVHQDDNNTDNKYKELVLDDKISLDQYLKLTSVNTNDNGAAIKQYMKEVMGYLDDQIQEFDTHFVVDGGIIIRKNTKLEQSTNPNAKQAMAIDSPNFLINGLKQQKLIRVRIGPSMAGFTTQIINAMQYWNLVTNNTIKFVVAAGSATTWDIAITNQPNTKGQIAYAFLPSGGKAGDFIVVDKIALANLIPNKRFLFDAQAAAIAHELGHTIGFVHTDWRAEKNGARMDIILTKDPLSIMNSTVEQVTVKENMIRRSLTAVDKRGLQALYPEMPRTPTYVAPMQSPVASVNVNWNIPYFPIKNTIINVKVLNRGAPIPGYSYNALGNATTKSYKIKLPTGLGCNCDKLTVLCTVQWVYTDNEKSMPSNTAVFYR